MTDPNPSTDGFGTTANVRCHTERKKALHSELKLEVKMALWAEEANVGTNVKIGVDGSVKTSLEHLLIHNSYSQTKKARWACEEQKWRLPKGPISIHELCPD